MSILSAITDAILSIGLGLFLVLLALPLAYLFGTIVYQILSLFDKQTRLDLPTEIETAIIGGIIGGLAFASIAPLVGPYVYDAQVATGTVEEPRPYLDIEYYNSQSVVQNAFHTSYEEDYSVYTLEVRNRHRKAIDDYSISIHFSGCLENSTVGVTTIGSALISKGSERIQFDGPIQNESVTKCYEDIYISELPPNTGATLAFLVDQSPEEQRLLRTYKISNKYAVGIKTKFNWQYQGRTYSGGRSPGVGISRMHVSRIVNRGYDANQSTVSQLSFGGRRAEPEQ